MTLDAGEIIVGGTGHLYTAPEGTAMPTHLNQDIPAAFVELGYTTDDGVKFTDTKSTNAIRPWQSFYPVRIHITDRDAMLDFSLMQWNEQNVILAFGGGGVTEPRPGEYRYTPPSPETVDIRAMLIDIQDGDRNYRIGIERGFVTSNTEASFNKKGPALLPITFGVLASDTGLPWFMDTDDPAFEPVNS